MRVLVVVEDDDEMRLLIGRVLAEDDRLEPFGEASTAEQAIAAARATNPDLVILDHYIEGDVMGLAAAPAIREAAPRAKILLFSGHNLAAEAKAEPAIDRFLPKDRLKDLLPTVRDMLGLNAQ